MQTISTQIKDSTKGFKGVYRLTKALLEKPEHFALQAEIVEKRNQLAIVSPVERRSLSEEIIGLIRQLHRVCKTEVQICENIVPTVGRAMIANNLTDATPTNTMLITHAALGSGGTTPVNGDTVLDTEVYRNTIASITNGSNIAYATAFYTATETSGTYAEAGIFCDGTGSADTGVLLSRVLIAVTKSTSETLTIDWELTIS